MRQLLAALPFVFTLLAGMPAYAQDTVPPGPRAPVQDTTRRMVSPGGAFLRSLIIPGWGQGSVGAYSRGGVFFAVQSTSWYMLLKTLARLGDAREKESRRVAIVSDSLRLLMEEDTVLARELSDPLRFDQRVGQSPGVITARGLIDSRTQQRQDWITYTIFFTLASGLDAFIAAQLADFPATITTRPAPTGGLQLQVGVPLSPRP